MQEVAAKFFGKESDSIHDPLSKEALAAPWTGCRWILSAIGIGNAAICIVRRGFLMVWIIEGGQRVLHDHAGDHERIKIAAALPDAVCTVPTDTEIHDEKRGETEEMLHTRHIRA